jgi:hypothetical protein
MLPITVADNSRQRARGREKGATAAMWEIVNGIGDLHCHPNVILQLYKTGI